jgi:Uma2 family endonuclease
MSFLTPEQYLEIERKAERKSEYWNGEMFAMAGASESHNLLVHNTGRHAGTKLQSEPCRVYQSDMRVRVLATGLNTYRRIESLEQYLLLSQDRMQAELFSRQPSGEKKSTFQLKPRESRAAAQDTAGSATDRPTTNTPPRMAAA